MLRVHAFRIAPAIRRLALAWGALVALAIVTCGVAHAGSIFLTGHDPDFHATLGGNTVGARKINTVAIGYILDPLANPFYAGGVHKFLLVESRIAPPGGHTVGKNGIVASGYVEGVDFEHHDASDLMTELNLLGTKYSGIVVCSDFGGVLTSAELDILNSRIPDIVVFLNAGGGVYAMAESNSGAHLTPNGGFFLFVPGVVSSTQLDQGEAGFTVTPFGSALGLTNADVNGNASHNVFNGTYGLNVVDRDAAGHILSLAGRPDQVVPVRDGTWGALKRKYAR